MPIAQVSVVIPTYNRADLLPQAVDSVLTQTRRPAEILIVDDGSTDHTPTLCSGFPDIRYIRQENAGVAAARNRGIREARGEWIALLDSDDLWEPAKLDVQLTALAQVPEARWCGSDCLVTDVENSPIGGRQGFGRVFEAFDSLDATPESYFSQWLEAGEVQVGSRCFSFFHGDFFELLCRGNVVLPSSSLIHRDVFAAVGLFNEELRFAEETEFFHRASAEYAGVMVMSRLVRYRAAREDSMTNPANTSQFIYGALLSLDSAVSMRQELSEREREAVGDGRRRLLAKLAYSELSTLNRRAAREAQASAWREGAPRTPRSIAIYAASLLPSLLLQGLHFAKRKLAAARS